MTLTPGCRLGSYEVLSALGSGGMGEVYRARDTKLGRDVAVKVVLSSFSTDLGRLRRFEQEARAAGSLNHPNILTIYDFGTHEGSPYLVSELLEGSTLRGRLWAGAIAARQAVAYSIQIAEGLAAAHEKGIVHRDLKPENLFVTKEGRIKILDFGLAKLTHPEVAGAAEASTITAATEPGLVVGTAGYMSPEQVRGLAVDSRSDIFSLGSILYEMLSGHRAFQGESSADMMSAILKEEPPALSVSDPNISSALESVVGHCLAKSREQRFQCASDLAFVLQALSGASRGSSTAASTARRESVRPVYRRLTFRPGSVVSARFSPDGQTILCTARWTSNSLESFSLRLDSPESRTLGLTNATVHAISSSGEMAIAKDIQRSHFFGGLGVLARMPLAGGAPREILEDVFYADWSPDGKQIAVVRLVAERARLDFPIGTPLYTATAGLAFPRVSPRGDLVAFLNYPRVGEAGGSVMVVDRNGKAMTLSQGWDSMMGLAWSPDGSEIWFTASKAGLVSALHAVTLTGEERVVEQVPGGLRLHDISRTGDVLLSHLSWRAGILCRLGEETQERDLSWFEYSVVADLSADGKTILFGEEGESTGPLHAVYLRKTDGSPAIRLGEGFPLALSPDGKWALSVSASEAELVLLPTGTGEPRVITHEGLKHHARAVWFPDGRRIVFAANEGEEPPRSYVQDLVSGDYRPVTPEGAIALAVSPDGRFVATKDPEPMLYPVEGGSGLPIPGSLPGDKPVRWDADGKTLFVREGIVPARIVRLDLATGLRELVWNLAPADPAVTWIDAVALTPDGRAYAYSYWHHLSDLYLVEGLE